MRMLMRSDWILASVLATALLAPASVMAEGYTSAQEYTSARKAGRGAAAITTGFLEIPGNMIDETSARGPWLGVPVGFGLGIAFTVRRVLVGSYELLTAPFAMPAGFEPIIEPEFAWGYFDQNYLGDEEGRIGAIAGADVTRRRGALVVRFPDQLLFGYGSTELTPEARKSLDGVAAALGDSVPSSVSVRGFSDSSGGSEAGNVALSRQRAQVVRAYLVSKGVSPARLEADGFGSVSPVASNDTAAGRHKNRRVELEVRASGVAARR